MNTPNIGWLYFKDYLRQGIDPAILFQNAPEERNEKERKEYFEKHFVVKNKVILEQEFSVNTSAAIVSELAKSNISLKTTYPGLTLGTGYTHETGELGEFKLGFFFDHTTGYPCIPGSTVKGCLRSMFPKKEGDDSDELSNASEKYNYLASVIRELPHVLESILIENELGEEYDQKEHPKREAFIDQLEMEIFEGKKPVIKEDGSVENQPICIYERDIFFDAYLVSTDHPAINRSTYKNQKPFIGDDYITPHVNRKKPEMSPFTSPIPLMFLKILPEVTIQFQFDVKDGLLTKEQKEELFRRLLLDFGIGAKTNVGYGQFEEVTVSRSSERRPSSPPLLPDDQIPNNANPMLRQNASFQGEVIAQNGEYNFYQFTVGRELCKVKKRTEKNPTFKVGDKVTIVVKLDYKVSESLAFQVK